MQPIKCKKQDINNIYNWYNRFGESDEDIKQIVGTQPRCYEIAYFTPYQANWSYRIELLQHNNRVFMVVTVFGEIRAAMPVYM